MNDPLDGLRVFIAQAIRDELRQLATAPPEVTIDPCRVGNMPSTRAGWIYAIVLIPEVHPWRIKVGFSSTDVYHRLDRFRTCCPTAKVLAIWDANENDEKTALARIKGRIGTSEVFIAVDFRDLIAVIDETVAAGRDE